MNLKTIIVGFFCGVLVVSSFSCWQYLTRNVQQVTPHPQSQKYRFGELCKDGLRVEYINTVRLPKSVVCQQEVGGN